MIRRLDCSKCGINQADKPLIALPVTYICHDCYKIQKSLDKQIKQLECENRKLNNIINDIEDWAAVSFDESLLKLIKKLKGGKRRIN